MSIYTSTAGNQVKTKTKQHAPTSKEKIKSHTKFYVTKHLVFGNNFSCNLSMKDTKKKYGM